MRCYSLRSLLLGIALLLGGCASPRPPDLSPPFAELAVNLTKGEIQARLGRPERVVPLRSASGETELWVYRRLLRHETEQVAVATQEIPYFDPITNESRPMIEPVYETQRVEVVEVLELRFEGDLLQSWQRDIVRGSQFSG